MVLLMVGMASAYMTVTPSSPANGASTIDRTPNMVFTPTTNNATAMTCNLTIGSTTQPLNFAVTNNTATTKIALSLPDGLYYWNVTCIAGSETNTSATRNLTVAFATYQADDVPKVTVDNIVGVLATIFSFATVIALVLLFNWIRGRKNKLPKN